MNAKEAAARLRPTFHLESMPAEARHHVKFVEDVASELGIEHSAFNLHQVADALDVAGIEQDSNEYPKMLFSRQHHAVDGVSASVYDARHDYVIAIVNSDDEAKALGDGWVDDPAKLAERGDVPVAAPVPDPAPVIEPQADPLPAAPATLPVTEAAPVAQPAPSAAPEPAPQPAPAPVPAPIPAPVATNKEPV